MIRSPVSIIVYAFIDNRQVQLSYNVTKRAFGHVLPAKIQNSPRIRAVWS